MAIKLYNINSSTNESVPSTGIQFGGNARTLAFQGTFNTIINIEASYDGGSNYISLTDSDGSALNIQAETIINISSNIPNDKSELLLIKGIGKKTLELYGEDILRIIDSENL